MRFTLRQLEVFVAVGRGESVSRAAEQLGLSQSATSTALAELERVYDRRLFDRIGKRLQLNELGGLLLPQAMQLLDHAAEIDALLAGRAGFGPMRVGATLTIGNYLATLLIGDFMRQHPGCRISLGVHNTAHIVRQVAHFELDLGLIEGDCQHPDLEVVPWIGDELAVFAAPEHPLAMKLAQQQEITLDDLIAASWIVREPGSGTRQTFDYAMRHVQSRLDIRLELEHTEAIKRAVESGLGIGCISRLALKEAFRRGSLVELPVAGMDLARQFHFVLHKQKYRTAGITAFLDLCKKVTSGVQRSDEIALPYIR
ncbi:MULTISPECIES: LysR family transcriptional regulator [Deefgea]|uniref:LysR family transcriptional regulator n=1 Tax=Deefgea chitinilytica TaxID=570276 RepID=A0ABS2CBH8_9NEIS|nr:MULTISPECIES: LysR family transcriptional regulator [Deefgea]MBM5571503.1 LysR family transcriptional regulator [Deefgea chitinilytica]MBM9888736.1 LysR family transcriptional regulator [Deefgea sp. CFH1-16]